MTARCMVPVALGHVVPPEWPTLKSGSGLGEVLEDENGRHGNRGSESPWRPCHVPGQRLRVSCGRTFVGESYCFEMTD